MKKANYLMAIAAAIAIMGSPMQVKAEGEDFDPVFYAETYEDVAAALGTDADALYSHYVNFGQKEGRFPNAKAAGIDTANTVETTQATEDSATADTPVEMTNWATIEPCLVNAPAVDFTQQGSENLREMLKDIPMNEELREVVIRIGDGATWDDNSGYQPFNKGAITKACGGYAEMCTDIVNGKDVNSWGYDTIYHEDITIDTIQQYDTLVVPGTGTWHGVFVLYVDPTTGALLTTEGNVVTNGIGKTRTGWNFRSWDKVIEIWRRETSDPFTNPDRWW